MELAQFDSGEFGVGFGLSIEERAALETQMAKRRAEEKLASLKFWGRISGTAGDYLIVAGLAAALEAPRKKFFFATSRSLVLQQMPDLTPEFAALAAGVRGRFLGDPAKLLGADADEPDAEEELDAAGNPVPRAARFSEAHRLAHTVGAIDADTALVPCGAFIVTPTHAVVADPLFGGLGASEAASLASYLHFREARAPGRAGALAKAAVLGAGDFMDPASEDEPEGCWALRIDGGERAHVRSLKWPGYFFTAEVGGPRFGGAYFGDGQENVDIAFML